MEVSCIYLTTFPSAMLLGSACGVRMCIPWIPAISVHLDGALWRERA